MSVPDRPEPRRGFSAGHLAANPLPPGIVGALGLQGYQLLVDVAGVGAGRLGPDEHLLVGPAREGLAAYAGIWWDLGEAGAP